MNDERIVDEIVTKFLLNTCRLRPRLSQSAVQAAMHCAAVAALHPVDNVDEKIPLTTGSVAEFYIEPMLPHIGDVDVMYHFSTRLAIPRGHPPPTQLPDEFHNYVKVYEIIDSHLPGYVYLELRYLLTECVDDGKYNAVEYDRQMYLSNTCSRPINGNLRGPAITIQPNEEMFSVDIVGCAHCLVWPPQPLNGQHDIETTAGQTQQLLILLSATDVMWLVWHIVSVDNMNGWASVSGDCHSHEQKLYC